MANTLGIPERTMLNIRLAADTVNVIGGAGGRLSAYQPLVCRVTNHNADQGVTGDEADQMALFYSKAHGHPWVLGKSDTAQTQIILQVGDIQDLDATCLYPDFDYSTFE